MTTQGEDQSALLDFVAIYRAATARAPWELDAEEQEGGRGQVRQYDEAVGVALEDLGRALEDGDLEAARAVERGLRAASAAFGSAEWALTT